MPSIYTSTYSPGTNLGPPGDSFAPIPGLESLVIADSFLSNGAVALINLYLGLAVASGAASYDFFVNITDTSSNYTVISTLLGGAENLAYAVNVSAVYNIPPVKSPPQLQATWTALGEPAVQIIAPTLFSFSAQIYPVAAAKADVSKY